MKDGLRPPAVEEVFTATIFVERLSERGWD